MILLIKTFISRSIFHRCGRAVWLCRALQRTASHKSMRVQVTEGPHAGRLALIDFGLVAEVPAPDRAAMLSATIHLANGAWDDLITDFIALGAPSFPLFKFAISCMRKGCTVYWKQSLHHNMPASLGLPIALVCVSAATKLKLSMLDAFSRVPCCMSVQHVLLRAGPLFVPEAYSAAAGFLPPDCDRGRIVPVMERVLKPYLRGGGARAFRGNNFQVWGALCLDGKLLQAVTCKSRIASNTRFSP